MEALYFPHLSLPASAWVNPTLLYFDRIDVIAPGGGFGGLFDSRTEALLDEGLVRPVHPEQYDWDRAADSSFVAYILGNAGKQPGRQGIERLHLGKIAHTVLAENLLDAGLLVRTEGNWLEGPSWVCGLVMGYLALQLSSHAELNLPLVTDEDDAQRQMVGFRPRRDQRSRKLRALSELLPVPADVPARELSRFKLQHERELTAFRGTVDRIVTAGALDEHGEERFEEELREAVRLRRHLEDEIGVAGWRGNALNVSISAAATAAPVIEASYYSAGAGLLALLAMGATATRGEIRRRRARRSPLVYAAIASREWRTARF